MNLSPAYLQRLEEATQQGMQQGMRAERRATISNLLRVRFGTLDEELSSLIESILDLPPQEYTRLLLQLSQLSREDLLNQFRT